MIKNNQEPWFKILNCIEYNNDTKIVILKIKLYYFCVFMYAICKYVVYTTNVCEGQGTFLWAVYLLKPLYGFWVSNSNHQACTFTC